MGSIILWFRGMWGVYEWVRWEMKGKDGNKNKAKEDNDGLLNCPTAMPGQERQDHWEKAWLLAKARNYRIQDDTKSVHFHVAPFLKSTKGLSMEDLISTEANLRTTSGCRKDYRDEMNVSEATDLVGRT